MSADEYDRICSELHRLALELSHLPDEPESTHASIHHATLQISWLRMKVAQCQLMVDDPDIAQKADAEDNLHRYSLRLQEWEKRKAAAEANLIRDLYEEILENQRKRMDAKARLAPIATD